MEKVKQQWGFYFNQDRCLGCKTCVVACKQWNEERRGDAVVNKVSDKLGNNIDPKYSAKIGTLEKGSNFRDPESGETNYNEYRKYYMKEMWRRLDIMEEGETKLDTGTGVFSWDYERSFISLSCNHCDKPGCAEACPAGRIHKDTETGAVFTTNPELCISCGSCKEECPWGAPQFYTEELEKAKPVMTKCTLCTDRTSEGLKPACVAACWNRALDAGPIDELKMKYPNAVDRIVGFDPSDTKPNIIFKQKTTFAKK